MYGTAFEVDDKVLQSDFVLPIGKAKIQRPGKDLTIVAHSIGVQVKKLVKFGQIETLRKSSI